MTKTIQIKCTQFEAHISLDKKLKNQSEAPNSPFLAILQNKRNILSF